MVSELQAVVGESNATDRDTELIAYSRDASLVDALKPLLWSNTFQEF